MMADFQEDLPQIPPSYGQLSGENDEMMINPTILLSEKNIRATYSCAGKNSRVVRKKRRHGLVSPTITIYDVWSDPARM